MVSAPLLLQEMRREGQAGGSANNVIKQMNDYPVNGGPDDELNYTFQYNPDNKPVTETQALSNSMTKYYYY